MSKNKAIEIILRIRPHDKYYDGIKVDEETNEISIAMPKDESQGYINNQKEKVKFKFDQIFDKDAKQEKVFDRVAKEVVEDAVDGFNGTIFAYGQTGSGKTFTMTGSGEHYDGRGIIPRTLAHIYLTANNKGVSVRVKIRYMQIYQGTGYDLLDPKLDPDAFNKIKLLEDLEKVKPLETADGGLRLNNLSVHEAKSLEEAMDFLMIGETNRVTCQTEKNDHSTRSHCIFMITLETSKPDSAVKSVAQINLVDLSGSEKLKNTNYEHNVEKEAISINLGLHYLERLIVSLNKKMNGENIHVPYRESLMNLVLRDSIGGNCITRMIATMSPKEVDMLEAISTCKFAQRVALIKNNIQRNETVDPGVIIARLKRENAQLRAELALLKGEDVKEELDKWEIEDCHKAIQEFIESEDPSASLIMSDRLKINECFYFFKNLVKKGGKPIFLNSNNQNAKENGKGNISGSISSETEERYQEEIKKLKIALESRNNEIAMLVSLINKKRGGNEAESLPVNRMKPEEQEMMNSVLREKPIEFTKPQKEEDEAFAKKKEPEISKVKKNNFMNKDSEDPKALEGFNISMKRHQNFERNNQIMNEKKLLGKEIGGKVQQCREKVIKLKEELEKIQRDNYAEGTESDRIEQEEQIREELIQMKKVYLENSNKLKAIFLEVESLQAILNNEKKEIEREYKAFHQTEQEKDKSVVLSQDSEVKLRSSKVKDKEVQNYIDQFLKAKDGLSGKS